MKILDSNRTGHVFAATTVGSTIAIAAATMGEFEIAWIGAGVPIYEILCTPDHDHASRKIRGNLVKRLWLTYWTPFKFGVPHRSKWSHSLLFGTPIRLVYALSPLFLVGHLLKLDVQLLPILWIALISDSVHLLKDGFRNPFSIIFGK